MPEENSSLSGAIYQAIEVVRANFQELDGESDRAAVILAMASFEDALELFIRSKFRRHLSDRIWKDIAGPGHTPMGTLKAKNDIAHAFVFYGSKTHKLIGTLGKIRNKFAHKTDVRSFSRPEILKHCNELNGNPINSKVKIESGTKSINIRWAYIETVQALEEWIATVRQYTPELGDIPPERLP